MPMPYQRRSRSNNRKKRGRRRRLPESAIMPYASSGSAIRTIPRGITRVHAAANAAATAYQAAQTAHQYYQTASKYYKSMTGGGSRPTKKLKQTTLVKRGDAKRKSTSADRHNKLKDARPSNPEPRGKGYNKAKVGITYTHPQSKIPAWKRKRLREYNKGNVYQTVLVSRTNRQLNSSNQLVTSRYPILLPECKNDELTQSVIFTPFCSHYSGIHTTYFRHVNAAGVDLVHGTDAKYRMDVIQNKADVRRHNLPSAVEGTHGSEIIYEQEGVANGTTQNATNRDNVFSYFDQLVKKNTIDLVFTSCRAFDVHVSVSMVRQIVPDTPFSLTDSDTQQLCNDLNYKGIDYDRWRVEWCTDFILPALKKGKVPTKSVNHTIVSNFLQTNAFNEDTVSQALDEAGETLLGTGLQTGNQDTADGAMSGNYYIIIKYQKVRKPQSFEYFKITDYSRQVEGTGWGLPSGGVSMPVISEESIDIQVQGGVDNSDGTTVNDGTPFSTNQGDERRACCYVHGKIKTQWGFRTEEESIPAVMSDTKTSNDYNKPQSLNICPTVFDPTDSSSGNNTYGLYEQSPDHENILGSTAQTGP